MLSITAINKFIEQHIFNEIFFKLNEYSQSAMLLALKNVPNSNIHAVRDVYTTWCHPSLQANKKAYPNWICHRFP